MVQTNPARPTKLQINSSWGLPWELTIKRTPACINFECYQKPTRSFAKQTSSCSTNWTKANKQWRLLAASERTLHCYSAETMLTISEVVTLASKSVHEVKAKQ
jgi:hypothetical protein